MECIIYNGKKPNGKIDWFGTVIPTFLLFMILFILFLYNNKNDTNKIPTADLPWAWVMMPTTTSAMGGLGEGMPFIVEGSWVIGFWRDAMTMQEPVVIGTLPGIPSETQTVDKGFYDPRNEESTQSEEAYKYKPDYGPYPLRTSDSDVSRLAKNDENNIHPEI